MALPPPFFLLLPPPPGSAWFGRSASSSSSLGSAHHTVLGLLKVRFRAVGLVCATPTHEAALEISGHTATDLHVLLFCSPRQGWRGASPFPSLGGKRDTFGSGLDSGRPVAHCGLCMCIWCRSGAVRRFKRVQRTHGCSSSLKYVSVGAQGSISTRRRRDTVISSVLKAASSRQYFSLILGLATHLAKRDPSLE